MVEFFQRIEQTSGASPVRRIPHTGPAPDRQRPEPEAGKPSTGPLLKVEDKLDLQIEPAAVRQLQPNTHLKFVISDETSRVIVQIIQSDTNQVLREVPPKSLSEALAALNGGLGT